MKTDGLVQWCRYKLTVCTRKETSLQEGTDDLEFAKVCLVSPLSKLCLFLSESEDNVVSSSEVKKSVKTDAVFTNICCSLAGETAQTRVLHHSEPHWNQTLCFVYMRILSWLLLLSYRGCQLSRGPFNVAQETLLKECGHTVYAYPQVIKLQFTD